MGTNPLRVVAWSEDVLCLSEKEVATINDGIVHFADGSVADLHKRKYLGKGPGSVNLLLVPDRSTFHSAVEKKLCRLEHGTHASFYGGNVYVIIEEHNDNELLIELSGTQDFVSDSVFQTFGQHVQVRCPESEGSQTTVFRNGRQVEGPPIKGIMRCKFPPNTTINIGAGGRFWIEPMIKNLDVSIKGSAMVSCLRTERVKAQISGSGDIFIGDIQGTASIQVSGSGSVQIANGNLEQIAASVSGTGSVTIGAIATKAHLMQTGSGTIIARRVTSNIIEEHGGTGNLIVLDYGPTP